MPLANSGYIQCPQLQAFFINKDDGTPLSAGYILFFEDEARTVPKDVFVQVQAPGPTYSYVNIGNQVTLSSVGTTQYLGTDSLIFLYPYQADGITLQLYYLQVFSSDNILQFVREGVPSSSANGPAPSVSAALTSNVVENSQFSQVLFDSVNGATINVSGTQTTAIAPGWNVITTGTGTFTVNQIPLATTAPGQPAYALDISSTGIDENLILSQTITNSPRILAGDYLSGFFTSQAIGPSNNVPITLQYVSSLPETISIVVGLATIGSFSTANNTSENAVSTANVNPPGAAGYVNIQLLIPSGAHVQVSSIQVVGVASNTDKVPYIQQSVPELINQLFNYYQQPLNFKPIPSLLTAWDFALNPAQWGSTQTISTTPSYIWDQTIGACSAGTVAVTADVTGIFPVMQCVTGAATQAFYLLQYLQGAQAFETAISNLSVNINAYSNLHPGVVVSVYLCAGNASSTIPAVATPFGTIASDGTFALADTTNWSFIPQPQGQAFYTTIAESVHADYGFNGWAADAVLGTRLNFAIVVTFAVPTSGTQVIIESISCVPGDIPTRPAPQTADEVLRECQYYYEKSYDVGTLPGTNTTTNQKLLCMNSSTATATGTNLAQTSASPFEVDYFTKRVAPTITLYTPSGTSGSVLATLNYLVSMSLTFTTVNSAAVVGTYWNTAVVGTNRATYTTKVGTGIAVAVNASDSNDFTTGSIAFHYLADARLGVV